MTVEEVFTAALFGIVLAIAFSNAWLVAVTIVGTDLIVTIRKRK